MPRRLRGVNRRRICPAAKKQAWPRYFFFFHTAILSG